MEGSKDCLLNTGPDSDRGLLLCAEVARGRSGNFMIHESVHHHPGNTPKLQELERMPRAVMFHVYYDTRATRIVAFEVLASALAWYGGDPFA